MAEKQLKEIMRRLWSYAENVRGGYMVDYYSIESIICETLGLYGSDCDG